VQEGISSVLGSALTYRGPEPAASSAGVRVRSGAKGRGEGDRHVALNDDIVLPVSEVNAGCDVSERVFPLLAGPLLAEMQRMTPLQ
jgi:hypothetical protein